MSTTDTGAVDDNGGASTSTQTKVCSAERSTAVVGDEVPAAIETTEDTKTPTTEFYKLTREEALSCRNTMVFHEMFDLETGHMKEAYTAGKPPPPLTGTVVYEVGTGRPYQYVRGMSLRRIHPDSVGMEQIKQEAAEAAAARTADTPFKILSTQTERQIIIDDVKVRQVAASTVRNEEYPIVSRQGGLRRVVAVHLPSQRPGFGGSASPAPLHSASPATGVSPPRTRTRTVTEKVLRWKTSSTPEPLETVPEVMSEPFPSLLRPPSAERIDFDMCNCIALVTSNWVHVDSKKPALADHTESDGNVETKRLLDGSETLRHLCTGYRNYVVNELSARAHRLSAYSCQSARHRAYNAYKSIVCKPNVQQTTTSGDTGTKDEEWQTSDLYRQTVIIDQYLNVFSTLADFNYTLSFSRQNIFGGGLSNVLIVDKLWTYNSDRRVFVPHYQLLLRDSYTESFVSEIRGVDNGGGGRIRHVRFLSTPNTVLYTNRLSLSRRHEPRQSGEGTTRRFEPFDSSADVTGGSLPLKKRRLAVETEASTARSATAPTTDVLVLRMNDWPRVDHRPGCSRMLELTQVTDHAEVERAAGESSSRHYRRPPEEVTWRAKNPTLIVFKHSLNDKEPTTLLCNILVEMHLGNETRY